MYTPIPQMKTMQKIFDYLQELSNFFMDNTAPASSSYPEFFLKVSQRRFEQFCEEFKEYSWHEYGEPQRIMGRTKEEDRTRLSIYDPRYGKLTIYY